MCLDMHQPMAKPAAAHRHTNALNNTFSVLNMFPSLLHEPPQGYHFQRIGGSRNHWKSQRGARSAGKRLDSGNSTV